MTLKKFERGITEWSRWNGKGRKERKRERKREYDS
jgi:hypothetical protein